MSLKPLNLPAIGAALAALPIIASAEVGAQQRPAWGMRTPPPRDHGGGKHHGFHIPLLVVEREVPVIIEREVVREVAPAAPPAPPPPPRKPFIIGKSYASLPDSCMKLIEGGASYYYCGGREWYRQLGGRDARYLAVRKP